jgi:hypothetical protein
MRRLLREPLLHFFVLGALLFALYGWLQGGLNKAPDEIVVTRGQQQALTTQFLATWQRKPTPEEMQGLVDGWVREEIMYREGLAMGLERDDPVIRRRIGQKLSFVTDGEAPAPPSAAELQGWLDAHPDKYEIEGRFSLRQVFFDPQLHGQKLLVDVAAAKRALEAGRAVAGDPTMLQAQLKDSTVSDLQKSFGDDFVLALKGVPIGGWQGPLRSEFGLHLVQLSATTPGRTATLEEARGEVERDLLQDRTSQASAAYYEKLRARYKVRLDAPDTAVAGSGK